MIGTIVNTISIITGTAIGSITKKGIKEEYQNALFNAIGLCAFCLGVATFSSSLPNSKYPVLFTDDGSLDIKNTYCMIQIPADLSVFADLGDLDIYDDKKSITKSLKSLLKYKSKDIPLLFIRNERLFAIMHISQFKEYICNSLDLLQ